MAFMCRSAGVQRWGAGAAKNPLFQTPTVSGGIAKVPLYIPQHISSPCASTQLYSNGIFTPSHVCKHAHWYSGLWLGLFVCHLQWQIHCFLKKQMRCACKSMVYLSWQNRSILPSPTWRWKLLYFCCGLHKLFRVMKVRNDLSLRTYLHMLCRYIRWTCRWILWETS